MPTEEERRTRSSKPMMEKRRRARINDSLHQLKNLVLDALNRNNPRHSKLEKADILEMTVRYLRSINRQHIAGLSSNHGTVKFAQFRTGYAECMNEVSRYLGNSESTSTTNHREDTTTRPNDIHIINCTGTGNTNTTGSGGGDIAGGIGNQGATAETQVRLQLLNHLASHCSNSTLEMQGEDRAPRGQDVAVPPPAAVVGKFLPAASIDGTGMVTSSNVVGHPWMSVMMERRNGKNEFGRGPPPVAEHHQIQNGADSNMKMTSLLPASQPAPATSDGITLVLPQHLIRSGQIPTHLIPVYAARHPVNTATPTQAPAAVPSNASPSSRTHVMPAPVAHSNAPLSIPAGALSPPSGIKFPQNPPNHRHNVAKRNVKNTYNTVPHSRRYRKTPFRSSSTSSSSSSSSSPSSTSSSPSQTSSSFFSSPPSTVTYPIQPTHALAATPSGLPTPPFSPVAIALPVPAQFIPAMIPGSDAPHPRLHDTTTTTTTTSPKQPPTPSHSSSPHHPPPPPSPLSSTPPIPIRPMAPNPGARDARANIRRPDDDDSSPEVNAKINPDPMWRPW